MRIDVSELMNLIELLDRDELGVRIFQVALEICKAVVSEMTPTTLDFYRMNASGSSNLMANPYVKGRTTFEKYFVWDWIPQQPDGLYSVTVRDSKLNGSVECLIQYESDGHAKGKTEYLQILRKFYQGIDLQLSLRNAHSNHYFENHGMYAIRSNLSKIYLDVSQEHYLVSWVYHFTRSHIWTILIRLDDMINPATSVLHKHWKQTKSNHKVSGIYDHIFFIGAFQLDFLSHNNTDLNTVWDDFPKLNFADGQTYLKSTSKEKKDFTAGGEAINDGKNEGEYYGQNIPFPLIETVDGNLPKWNNSDWSMHTFVSSFEERTLDVQTLSIERYYYDNENNPPEWGGLITPYHITKTFMIQDVIEDMGNKLTNEVILTLMSYVEMRFMEIANADVDVHNGHEVTVSGGIQWQGIVMNRKCESAAGRKSGSTRIKGLGDLKMELRNEPHKYRHRSHFTLQDMFKSSQSLKGCAIRSLSKTLPDLDPSIKKYLEQFNIPNAVLFCRMLRVPNILALREMARQSKKQEVAEQYQHVLKTLPLGTQTELMYLFDKLRVELDVVLNPNTYLEPEQVQSKPNMLTFFLNLNESLGLGFSETQLLQIIAKTDPKDPSFDTDVWKAEKAWMKSYIVF